MGDDDVPIFAQMDIRFEKVSSDFKRGLKSSHRVFCMVAMKTAMSNHPRR
jgi:hypothetical protein